MVKTIKNLFAPLVTAGLALVAVAVAPVTYAATSYDFSSSTAESNALVSALGSQVLVLILTAFAVLSGIGLTIMGIAWIWKKFKKFTGLGAKI